MYSQAENTITNNVLLMLSNLYSINPRYYEEFMIGIIDDSESYEVIPQFRQQRGNLGNGIIDGHIKVNASRIIIETKIHGLEGLDKLLKYTDSFHKNEYCLLLHLSTAKYTNKDILTFQNRLKEKHPEYSILFQSITYEELVAQLGAITESYHYEDLLQKLNEDFKDYCVKSNLMPSSKDILRAMACGQSFDLNIKYQFYFDLASRGYSPFNYLGIYKWKAVRYIGRVENMIEANYEVGGTLDVIDSTHEVTEAQKVRLKAAIDESVAGGWDLEYGHRFFLLKDFHETYFEKKSPGGIFRVRYFDLEDYFNPVPKTMEEIATSLRKVSWE